MTSPSPCDRLDAYLGGHLSRPEEAAFEAHAAHCDTCLGASEATDFLAPLAAVACPPGVLEAALAQTSRRAPDRVPSRRRPSRWVRLGAATGAVLAVAVTLILLQPQDPTPRPIAATTPSVRDVSPPAEPDALPLPPAPTVDAEVPRTQTEPPSRAVQQPDRVPRPEAVEPSDVRAPDALSPNLAAVDSVAVAREEVLLALAIVADAQSHATEAVTDGVGRVSDALYAAPSMLSPQTP